MKKLSLIFAMVFAVSMAMAQNTGSITQYGTNIGNVEQTGSLNDATITQGAVAAPVTNWGTNLGADWKYGAFIYQTGIDNDAVIDVNSSSNGAQIDQLGDYNWAKQELNAQISKTTNFNRMGLDINQNGVHNWANQVTQPGFGTYGVQGMMINQIGEYNIADQMSIGGMQNTSEIEQIGDNNNNPTVSLNTFNVSATGLQNPLTLLWTHKPAGDFTQYMFQNKGITHIYVQGNNNNTFQYQEYVTYGGAEGQGQNDALMDVYGSGNDVAQGQLGDLNVSEIDIDGSNNVVTSSQFGDNNRVNIDLVGGSNNCVVGIEQIGNGHDATVFQSGASNFAYVLQQP